MRLKAYLLAGDPNWLQESVRSYYDSVEEIVVSYDAQSIGWTGQPIMVAECLQALRRLDNRDKMRYVEGTFFDSSLTPQDCETRQRRAALEAVGTDCDWILQVDTDEVFPNFVAFRHALEFASAEGVPAVEWPMRVFFGSTRSGRHLEICAGDGGERFEYPGPLAVTPGAGLHEARRISGPFLRVVISGDTRSLQVRRPPTSDETRLEIRSSEDAVLHFSWSGSPQRIRAKTRSWGHSNGWRIHAFYYVRWRPVPVLWRITHDFHPFAKGLWPRLRPYRGQLPGDRRS